MNGRWTVHTDRPKECARTGLGPDDLNRTLRHLQSRGDETATVVLVAPYRRLQIDFRQTLPVFEEIPA